MAGTPPLASDLDLFGEPLRPRAVELRRYLARTWDRGSPADRAAVAEQLSLALTAAFAGDQAAAEACLAAAETVTGPWRAAAAARAAEAAAAQKLTAAAAAERRLARLRAAVAAEGERGTVTTDTIAVINGGLSGRLPVAGPDPYLVIATDGSYSGRYYGWAYLTSDGRWGARGGLGGPDPSGSLIAELAAAGLAAAGAARRAEGVLAVDSRAALGWLSRWRSGCGELPGIDGDHARDRRRRGWVASAAAEIRRRPGLDAVHIPGHRGHHLNEAADILAKMARRWRSGEDQATPDQMTARIGEVCAAFLRSWYGT